MLYKIFMKQITCSEFRKNMSKYLDELPVELLHYSDVVAVVQHPTVVQENVVQTKNVVQDSRSNVVQHVDKISELKKMLGGTLVEPDKEVRVWVEDGIEHKVTKEQMQKKFGKNWETFWAKAVPVG